MRGDDLFIYRICGCLYAARTSIEAVHVWSKSQITTPRNFQVECLGRLEGWAE